MHKPKQNCLTEMKKRTILTLDKALHTIMDIEKL